MRCGCGWALIVYIVFVFSPADTYVRREFRGDGCTLGGILVLVVRGREEGVLVKYKRKPNKL